MDSSRFTSKNTNRSHQASTENNNKLTVIFKSSGDEGGLRILGRFDHNHPTKVVIDRERHENHPRKIPAITQGFTSAGKRHDPELLFYKRDYLFSELPKHLRSCIQMDDVAYYSTTDMRTADRISDLIAALSGLERNKITLTDGTACVGGNTISFCKKFHYVVAVEINESRCKMLTHNVKKLGYKNIDIFNKDYIEVFKNWTQDIVFLDPPWGGPSYIEKSNIELFLGSKSLGELCNDLKGYTKYVVLKVPKNLDFQKLQEQVQGKLEYHYQFRKMVLVVIDCRGSKSSKIVEEPVSGQCGIAINDRNVWNQVNQRLTKYFDDYQDDADLKEIYTECAQYEFMKTKHLRVQRAAITAHCAYEDGYLGSNLHRNQNLDRSIISDPKSRSSRIRDENSKIDTDRQHDCEKNIDRNRDNIEIASSSSIISRNSPVLVDINKLQEGIAGLPLIDKDPTHDADSPVDESYTPKNKTICQSSEGDDNLYRENTRYLPEFDSSQIHQQHTSSTNGGGLSPSIDVEHCSKTLTNTSKVSNKLKGRRSRRGIKFTKKHRKAKKKKDLLVIPDACEDTPARVISETNVDLMRTALNPSCCAKSEKMISESEKMNAGQNAPLSDTDF